MSPYARIFAAFLVGAILIFLLLCILSTAYAGEPAPAPRAVDSRNLVAVGFLGGVGQLMAPPASSSSTPPPPNHNIVTLSSVNITTLSGTPLRTIQ